MNGPHGLSFIVSSFTDHLYAEALRDAFLDSMRRVEFYKRRESAMMLGLIVEDVDMSDKPRCADCWFFRMADEDGGVCMYHPPSVVSHGRGGGYTHETSARPDVKPGDFCAYYWDGKDGGLDG